MGNTTGIHLAISSLQLAVDCGGELDQAHFKAAHDELVSVRDKIVAYDSRRKQDALAPTGEDYTRLLALLGLSSCAGCTSCKSAPSNTVPVVPTLEQLVATMKEEVLQMVQSGRIPRTVRSFSTLHDHMDANCLGGLCEDGLADALIAHFGGRDTHEGMPQGMLDFINAAQGAIDDWLKTRPFTRPQSSA